LELPGSYQKKPPKVYCRQINLSLLEWDLLQCHGAVILVMVNIKVINKHKYLKSILQYYFLINIYFRLSQYNAAFFIH